MSGRLQAFVAASAAVALVATLPAAGRARAGSALVDGCQAGDTLVDLSGFAFSPGSLNVAPGTTVCWTNKDAVMHTVTSDTAAFDSGALAQDQTFRFTFTTAGTYAYHCNVHPTMTGRLVAS